MKKTQVQVLATLDVSGYGRVEAGIQELPEWLADMLVERGYALPQGENGSSPADDEPLAKKRK